MANVLDKYGIEMAATPETLEAAREAYENIVATVKESTESASSKESEIRTSLLDSTGEAAKIAEDILVDLRHMVFTVEAGHEDRGESFFATVFAHLYEGLKDVKSDARVWRDSYVSQIARSQQTTDEIPENVEELKSDAESLKDFVENLFGMLHPMGAVPKEFPTKELKAGISPDLSRLPIVRRKSGQDGVTTSYISYSVDGEEIPERNLSVIARDYLSTPDNIVKRSDVTAALKAEGLKVSDETWSVEVNGKTLSRDASKDEE